MIHRIHTMPSGLVKEKNNVFFVVFFKFSNCMCERGPPIQIQPQYRITTK